MKPALLLTCLLLGVFSLFAQSSVTVTIQPDSSNGRDAILHGLTSERNVNYGENIQFATVAATFGGTFGITEAIIDFDLFVLPANATIVSAQLSFYAIDSARAQPRLGQHTVAGTGTYSNDARLIRVTSPWNQDSVTWDTKPSIDTNTRISLSGATSPSQNYLNLDVTAMTQLKVNDPANNHGFLLQLKNPIAYTNMNFASSNHPDPMLRPKLEITYLNSTGIGSASSSKLNLSVFPNPMQTSTTITFNNPDNLTHHFNLIDLQGRIVYQRDNITGEQIIVERNALSNGMYTFQLTRSGELPSIGKLIIQ